MGLLDDLYDWYWRYGRERMAQQALPKSWLPGLYALRRQHTHWRYPWAVLWAPSEGLVTQISGALCDIKPAMLDSLWRRGIATYTDASTSSGDEQGDGLDLILLDRAGALRALAFGHAVSSETSEARSVITPEFISSSLDSAGGAQGPRDPEATAYAHEIFTVLDEISALECDAFSGFIPAGGWRSVVSDNIYDSPFLNTDLRNAQRFAEDLFWNGDGEVTEIFAASNQILRRMGDLTGKQVTISRPAFEALLETPFVFSKSAREAAKDRPPAKKESGRGKKSRGRGDGQKQIFLHTTERSVAITLEDSAKGAAGLALRTTVELSALALLIAAVRMPAHSDLRLDADSARVLIAPAPRTAYEGAERSTPEAWISLGKAISLPASVIEGGGAAALCVLGADESDAIQKNAVRVAAFAGASLIVPEDAGPDGNQAAQDAVAHWNQIERQMNTELGKVVGIEAGWVAATADSGAGSNPSGDKQSESAEAGSPVSGLIKFLAQAIPFASEPDRQDLASLLEQALPKVRDESHREAFMRLCEAIPEFCSAAANRTERKNAVAALSAILRKALSVRPDQLQSIPRGLGDDHAKALKWTESQMDKWADDPALDDLFSALKMSDDDRDLIVKGLREQFDGDECASWMCRELGHLETGRDTRHAKRYAAVQMSRALFPWDRSERRRLDARPEALQALLDGWTDATREHEETMHYQTVLAPMVNVLADMADIGATWVRQPGDDEIERLHQEVASQV